MKYISEGYSTRQIADQSCKEEHFVRKDIQRRLDENKIYSIDEVFEYVHELMIDGYVLPGEGILLVYYAFTIEKVIWFSITGKEDRNSIVHDLHILRDSFKYDITTFIIDGSPSILAAVNEVYPEAIIQRYLVHIQRQVFNYVSRNPKTVAGKALVKMMNYSVLSNPDVFPKAFEAWKTEHFDFLIEKSISREGRLIFTHTSLRKAIRHMENALPNMYSFKLNSNIEKSTNKLEGYFGVLTEEGILEHKGLSPKRLRSFVALWIYFRNNR